MYLFLYFYVVVFSKFSGNSCVDEVMFLQLLMFRGIFKGKHREGGGQMFLPTNSDILIILLREVGCVLTSL